VSLFFFLIHKLYGITPNYSLGYMFDFVAEKGQYENPLKRLSTLDIVKQFTSWKKKSKML